MNPLLNMLFSLMFPNMGGMNNMNSGMNSNPLLNMLMGGGNPGGGNNQMMGSGSGNPLMDMLMGGMTSNMNGMGNPQNNMMNSNMGNMGNMNPNMNNMNGNSMGNLDPFFNMMMGNQSNPYMNVNPSPSGRRHKHSKRRR